MDQLFPIMLWADSATLPTFLDDSFQVFGEWGQGREHSMTGPEGSPWILPSRGIFFVPLQPAREDWSCIYHRATNTGFRACDTIGVFSSALMAKEERVEGAWISEGEGLQPFSASSLA